MKLTSSDYMAIGIVSGILCCGIFLFMIMEPHKSNKSHINEKYTIIVEGMIFTNLTRIYQREYKTADGKIIELYHNNNFTVMRE